MAELLRKLVLEPTAQPAALYVAKTVLEVV